MARASTSEQQQQAGEEEKKQPRRERLEPTGTATAFERSLLARPPVRPSIGAVPRSDVFGRLSAFLPRMAAANAELEARLASGEAAPEDVDVTAVDEAADGPVVEMDLACGVFDVRSAAALAAAERAVQAGGPLEAGVGVGGGAGFGGGGSSSSEASSSSDNDDDDDGGGVDEQGADGAAAATNGGSGGHARAARAKRGGGVKPPRKKLIQELPPKQE